MHEKELYPAVEKFLKTKKNCLSEYVGTELSLKRGKSSLRADVFGISNQGEKSIYLCEGKKELKHRSFGKVIGEAVELLKYADYVYIFGPAESFETEDLEDQLSKCKRFGIGILSVNNNEKDRLVEELLEARRNDDIKELDKKEVFLRVFIRDIEKSISDIIFQAAFEYIKLNWDTEVKTPCVSYIDVYNSIFCDEEVKAMVRRVIGYHHTLKDRDVRREFQRRYGSSPYVRIERKADILDDVICFTEEGLKKGKSPILLK
jgi:hypothetical protein